MKQRIKGGRTLTWNSCHGQHFSLNYFHSKILEMNFYLKTNVAEYKVNKIKNKILSWNYLFCRMVISFLAQTLSSSFSWELECNLETFFREVKMKCLESSSTDFRTKPIFVSMLDLTLDIRGRGKLFEKLKCL